MNDTAIETQRNENNDDDNALKNSELFCPANLEFIDCSCAVPLLLNGFDDSSEKSFCKLNREEVLDSKRSLSPSSSSTSSSCLLERFSADITAMILSHLSLLDIANVSLVSKNLYAACRSNELWRRLLRSRWNVIESGNHHGTGQYTFHNYFDAYQRAHAHPHDLWITHWNCVHPMDGLAPGRCCIRHATPQTQPQKQPQRVNSWKACPSCRDWQNLPDISIKNATQAMAAATRQTRNRFASIQDDFDAMRDSARVTQAFQQAATFHRRLSTIQYTPGPSNFLTDLLFFNLTDPATSEGQWELKTLLKDALNQEEDGPSNPAHEVTNHSWHMIKLTNPDFYRPIVFQVGVQRPECFMLYPSEGYLPPGASMFVTVGIRPFGSALANAFEALNVQRDGLQVDWADLYTEEAHLPMAPILVRYQFANAPPGKPDMARNTAALPPYHALHEQSQKMQCLEYHWKSNVPAHHIRTIHLSAHVHAHYCFDDFLRETLTPWDSNRDYDGPYAVFPALQENYPAIHERIQPIPLQRDNSDISKSHTEGPCVSCRMTWGLAEEELAHAYTLAMGNVLWQRERRRHLLENIRSILVLAETDLTGDSWYLGLLLYTMSVIIQTMKAFPWMSGKQRNYLLSLEASIDSFYESLPIGGSTWIPWRTSGIYRHALCTDSVFGGKVFEELGDSQVEWKDEPDYLDTFRHLVHNPGDYCVGLQQDPNHIGETYAVGGSSRYARSQSGFETDMFMDSPISALQAGICMMRDPRSLILHGIYDRIPYPGSLVRRPRINHTVLQVPRPISQERIGAFLEEHKVRLALWEAFDYNTFRLEELDSFRHELNTTDTLFGFEHGVPPPGLGRFPFSKLQDGKIVQYDTGLEAIESHVRMAPAAHEERPQRRPPAVPGPENGRGLRMLQLLWTLGARLGLAVIDSPDASRVFVDRTILIASQWVSISLMVAPILWTLCARYARLIPAQPVDYSLDDLPFRVSNEMRFLTESECGAVAVLVLFMWLALGRWNERYTNRDFFRVMLEHLSPTQERSSNGVLSRVRFAISIWLQRRWDAFCPLFLQRRVFSPHWNRRTHADLLKHIAFWRSQKLYRVHATAQAASRRSVLEAHEDNAASWDSSTRKILVGAVVALGSFCSSSPHFWLNLVTIFSCSISLGMSVSLHSMEKGRSAVSINNTGSLLKSFSLTTVVILSFLVGQLVGSSGGTMFLAEFIVTTISLVFGGAGTISANAMESWGCFFCLSTSAFWGYLFGRVALMDGIRQKRGGYSSFLLSRAVAFLFLFWVFVFLVSWWDFPISVMIIRHNLIGKNSAVDPKALKLLQ